MTSRNGRSSGRWRSTPATSRKPLSLWASLVRRSTGAWPAMGSSRQQGAGRFALGAALRAVAIGALAFGALMAGERHLWATALVQVAALLLIGLDLARSAAAADRLLAQFVEGLTAEGNERPAPQPGLRQAAGAIE